jgi:glycosyltransferase involved in cell wall biosynthesis
LHLENAVEFKKKGYNVVVFSKQNSPLQKKAVSKNINTYSVSISNLSFLNPLKILKIVKLYRKKKIDTVIFSASQDLKAGSIAAKLAGVKNIVYMRGLASPIKASFINRLIFKNILTHIIANSDETKRMILLHLNKYIDSKKVKTVYHGIDINIISNKLEMLDEIKKRGHGIILGNAGRLDNGKGLKKLIVTAKKLKDKNIDFTLFIAGTGKLHTELQAMINDFNLHNYVILLGFVKEMDKFMSSIDIFTFSSESEGFGFVMVEAMARKIPVVAFNISCIPEIIENNKSGFTVDYPDLNMFAEKIIYLINNIDIGKKMGEKGFEIVKHKFVLSDKITEIENFIKI